MTSFFLTLLCCYVTEGKDQCYCFIFLYSIDIVASAEIIF